MTGINPEQLAQEIDKALNLYTLEITSDIKEEVEIRAKDVVKVLKSTSPTGHRGKYKKAWKSKKMFENANDVRFVVYSTEYRLEHLLEKGHALRNGKKTRAQPHIKPAAEEMEKEFQKNVEIIIGRNK